MIDHAEQVRQPWSQRLLFVDSQEPTSLPAPRAHERFVITALMRRGSDISAGHFRRRIEVDLAARLRERQVDLGLASLKIFRDVSAGGILSFFLQLTRSHGYTAFLCRVLRRSAPPPYRIPYGVLYDNVVQINFEGSPDSSQVDAVLALLRSPEFPTSQCTVLASFNQYTVYDDQPTRDERKRVDICFLVNRPKGMTREACQGIGAPVTRIWRCATCNIWGLLGICRCTPENRRVPASTTLTMASSTRKRAP
jgi:hypothetical protein